MEQRQTTGIMIPVGIVVSRETGKVIRVDKIDGTPEEVTEYVKGLRRIGRAAQRALRESETA